MQNTMYLEDMNIMLVNIFIINIRHKMMIDMKWWFSTNLIAGLIHIIKDINFHKHFMHKEAIQVLTLFLSIFYI